MKIYSSRILSKRIRRLRLLFLRNISTDPPTKYDPRYLERKWGPIEQNPISCQSRDPSSATFSMLLPPPNITGQLHLGHALTLSVEDAIARWRRMCGDHVVWVPGTDHAGIAAQVMVERHLWATRHVRRQQLGREKFTECMRAWQKERCEEIEGQMRRLCVSLDWHRMLFTLDKRYSESVNEAFVRLFDAGLLYRGERIVNWCCHLQSVVSDIEVERRSVDGAIYDIAYRWQDEPSVELVVSTTRPETLPADTAVAVHPLDPRFTRWVGRRLVPPLAAVIDGGATVTLPVIADVGVEPEFGTGAVKITPAHDAFDHEVSVRHNLPAPNMSSHDGRVNDLGGSLLKGLSREQARETVVEYLRANQLLRNVRHHRCNIPVCSRTGDVLEPMLKQQWFVRTSALAERALEAVSSGRLQLDPPSYAAVWREWLLHCRDWCISRQLWWGHRIPAYCVHSNGDGGAPQWTAAHSETEALQKLGMERHSGGVTVHRDVDVLDTWFSSALMPLAAFGWPKQTCDLSRLFPLALMETGRDILFFWVARMVMISLALTDQLPFKKVLLHGLICDGDGRKMSKSRGNVIDPNDYLDGASIDNLVQRVRMSQECGLLDGQQQAESACQSLRRLYPSGIAECGADALRLALCHADIRAEFVSVDAAGVMDARLFCNKLWQAGRFVIKHASTCLSDDAVSHQDRHARLHERVCGEFVKDNNDAESVGVMCAWMLACVHRCVFDVDRQMAALRPHRATRALDRLVHRQFCDVFLEAVKPTLHAHTRASSSGAGADAGVAAGENARLACDTMLATMEAIVRLLWPFCPTLAAEVNSWLVPFTVERSGDQLPPTFPRVDEWRAYENESLLVDMETCLDMVRQVRRIRQQRVSPSNCSVTVHIDCPRITQRGLLTVAATLARCQMIADCGASLRQGVELRGEGWRASVQCEVDRGAEVRRMAARRDVITAKLLRLNTTINSNKFRRASTRHRDATLSKKFLLEAELSQLDEQTTRMTS